MIIKSNTSIKEIDFDILEQVGNHPGITAVELGRKVYLSRSTVLAHTEKLENLQFLRRKQATKGTYLCYLNSNITLEAIQHYKLSIQKCMVDSIQDNLSLSDIQDLHMKLMDLTGSPRKTLIDISFHGEISCQELAQIDGVSSSAIDKRLSPLRKLKLVKWRKDKSLTGSSSYVYSLVPPLTSELIQEALNFPGLPGYSTNSAIISITSEDLLGKNSVEGEQSYYLEPNTSCDEDRSYESRFNESQISNEQKQSSLENNQPIEDSQNEERESTFDQQVLSMNGSERTSLDSYGQPTRSLTAFVSQPQLSPPMFGSYRLILEAAKDCTQKCVSPSVGETVEDSACGSVRKIPLSQQINDEIESSTESGCLSLSKDFSKDSLCDQRQSDIDHKPENKAVSLNLDSLVNSIPQNLPSQSSFQGLTTDEFLDKILDKLIEFKQEVRLLKDCFHSLEARIEAIELHQAKESNGQTARNQLDQKMQILFSQN